MPLTPIFHPEYTEYIQEWGKYRLTYAGGRDFIIEYLRKYAGQEDADVFEDRKALAYCPAYAKKAINDVKNAIFERMADVTRVGGPKSYHEAAKYNINGDFKSLNNFIGSEILPELLVMGRVGVYIDRPTALPTTRATAAPSPYLTMYPIERILSWAYDRNNNLSSLLLRAAIETKDERGLITGFTDELRHFQLTPSGVVATIGDNAPILLPLSRIPFVVFEITHSLLRDVADYQIALLNLESLDMLFIRKLMFPIWVEQTKGQVDFKQNKGDDNTRNLRPLRGLRVPQGLDYPAWLSPTAEILTASFEKENQLKQDIAYLISTNIATLQPKRQSADSKQFDSRSLEAGISYLGIELQSGEQEIGEIWADYEGTDDIPLITYPTTYSTKSDADRQEEADRLNALVPILPSKTYQVEMAKQIAQVLLAGRLPNDKIRSIFDELDNAPVIVTDPTIIKTDLESGLVSTATASRLRGYPEGEVEQAKKDHAERLARIAAAQTPGVGAARGVTDASADPEADAKQEKTDSQDPDLQDDAAPATRGEGQ